MAVSADRPKHELGGEVVCESSQIAPEGAGISCQSSLRGSVRELLNLQDVRGKAKAYQFRQLLQLVERYNLSLGGEE